MSETLRWSVIAVTEHGHWTLEVGRADGTTVPRGYFASRQAAERERDRLWESGEAVPQPWRWEDH
jgi:hypothetical protein